MPASSPSSFNHFQFTFNCSASNSGKNSFIEPDVCNCFFITVALGVFILALELPELVVVDVLTFVRVARRRGYVSLGHQPGFIV